MERARERSGERRPVLIVVDPRRTATAEVADLHVAPKPGTDGILLSGLLAELLRRGAVDRAFIEAHTSGFAEHEKALLAFPRDYVLRNCGVSGETFDRVADTWAASRAALSFWAMGVNQKITGANTSGALINLHLATGHVGRPGAGPFSLTGQPNAMGGREVGGLANLLPAHRDYFNPDHRREVQALWGSGPLPERKGLTAVELFERAASGRVDVLWIVCTNPAVSIPNQRMVREAFARTPLVILQDVVSTTATAAHADLLLPAAGWAEKSGTVTNSERRVSAVRQAVSAPGECLPDWRIACEVARRLGWEKAFAFETAEDVWAEHVRATA
ncbi:MAG: molybdopterin-dependent oxidoreductase, partial [Candidatus Methylomirabilis sp.]|nr:molybdopterin-dependent oxidoreductase [Deltaproteobacteria bacterium]